MVIASPTAGVLGMATAIIRHYVSSGRGRIPAGAMVSLPPQFVLVPRGLSVHFEALIT